MVMPSSVIERYLNELGLPDRMFMPVMNTSNLPRDVKPHVEEGIKRVRDGDPIGVEEERYVGEVPVHIDRNPPYAGVTEFRPSYEGPVAKRMGISDRIGNPKYAKRVGAHEARHVRSEKMLKYADISPDDVRLIMESYAEFGEFKALMKAGSREEAEEIIRTTPYPSAMKFGFAVDRTYVSERDGKRGYETFIRDIFRNRSMARTLDRLGQNIRASIEVYSKAA